MVNRTRQHLRPDNPKDLKFELDHTFIPEGFLKSDIDVDGQRHLLFATDRQLELLANAKTWYLDGTFKVARKPFYQLFSVHAFVRQGDSMKQIPLAFCLMSKRRKVDYKKVLKKLKRRLLYAPKLEVVVTDFESAIWQSVTSVFPDVEVRGCGFHWAQAANRKVGELGLQTAYRNEDGVHKLIRQALALNFLPAEHIRPALKKLQERVTDAPALVRLLEYIEQTWVNSDIWTPPTWSVFKQAIRTNNDVEGWHRRLNVKAGESKLSMYMLIKMLHKEASLVPVQCKMVSEGKLRRRCRKKTGTVQAKLFVLWDSYDAGELTVSRLMKDCAKLYGL